MTKVHFEYGDLVAYSSGNIVKIGRYVRKDKGLFVIVPEGKNGNVVKRKPDTVIKLALIYKNYKTDLQKQTWSLQ